RRTDERCKLPVDLDCHPVVKRYRSGPDAAGMDSTKENTEELFAPADLGKRITAVRPTKRISGLPEWITWPVVGLGAGNRLASPFFRSLKIHLARHARICSIGRVDRGLSPSHAASTYSDQHANEQCRISTKRNPLGTRGVRRVTDTW